MVATVLLEHLLGHHFADFFPKVSRAVEDDVLFRDTFARCAKFDQSKDPGNAALFDRLKKKCQIKRK